MAAGIVAVLAAGVLAAVAFAGAIRPSVAKEVACAVVGEGGLLDGGIEAVGEGGALRGTSASVPQGFEAEAIMLSDREELRVSEECGVVGFVEQGDAEDAFEAAAGDLAAKGWVCKESGQAACGTFIKEGGSYRWLFVACVQVANSTSVVVQYSTMDGKDR